MEVAIAPLAQRLIVLASRLALAAAFLWAGLSKLPRPLELAEAIIGYQILPEAFIAPAALVLPLVEIWAALAVLFAPRPYRRAGAAILLASLVIFVAAAAQGLIRGLDFDCGCFGPSDGRKPGLIFFLQDGGLILACALILFLDREKPPAWLIMAPKPENRPASRVS